MKKRGVKKGQGRTQQEDSKQQMPKKWTREILGDIFPPYFQYIVFTICLVVRIYYVSQPTNWWILHPDEVYQSLEVAHSEVYGYGFRPYEYLPSRTNPNDTNIRQRELQLGMAAMRSFLYPRFFVMVSFILNVINIDVRPFLAWKVAHVCVTSLLSLAVYKFSKKLFSSHDIGCFSCLLVATSVHLNVFGTHTLINSFLAPIAFFCISVFISPRHISKSSATYFVEDPKETLTRTLEPNCTSETNRCAKRLTKEKISSNLKDNKTHFTNYGCKPNANDRNHNFNHAHRIREGTSKVKNVCGHEDVKEEFEYAYDDNYLKMNCYTDKPEKHWLNSFSSTLKIQDVDNNGSLPNDFLLKNVEFLPNGVQGVKMFNGKCKITSQPDLYPTTVTERPFLGIFHKLWSFVQCDICVAIASFILSTCSYIRPDLAMFCFVTCAVHCKRETLSINWYLKATLGTITALIVCISEDFAVYGVGVISPINWFFFNVWKSFSGALFGSMEFTFYLNVIFLESYTNLALAIIGLVFICLTLHQYETTQNIVTVWKVLFSFVFLCICYSLQDHKEARHVHNLFCVFYVVIAVAIVYFLKMNFSVFSSRLFILLFTVLMSANLVYNYPSPNEKSNERWVYRNIYYSNDVNRCLDYVAGKDDVTGVFLDTNIHMTGGFSILHRNVPMLSFLTYEFYEFDNVSTSDKNFVTFSRVSDFISILNTPYLLKTLLQNRKYNYLIMEINRNFIDFGYKVVFTSGQMKVLRRSNETSEERKLFKLAKSIPIGSNATVLNYEGNWLVNLGAYEKARIRLEASLSSDQSIINNYQLLSSIYNKSGKRKNALKLMQRCFKLVNKEKCTERTRPAILHQNYDISF